MMHGAQQEPTSQAPVAELVDAPDSKSGSFGSVGSSPTGGTKNPIQFNVLEAIWWVIGGIIVYDYLPTQLFHVKPCYSV